MMSDQYSDQDRERRHPERQFDERHRKRSPFEVDYGRIVFSESFRVLQGKTQVFTAGRSVKYRTRLTHSIEVAQLARGLCREALGPFHPDEDLVVAICVAHDIGHPPLGHAGERALNLAAERWGGFDANAQNLRVVDVLECKHPAGGLNLTRATLDGLIKLGQSGPRVYQGDASLVDWVKARHSGMSLEAQLVDWADTAAYCVADIEDACRLGVLDVARLRRMADDIAGEVCSNSDAQHERERLHDIAMAVPESRDFTSDEAAARMLKEWTSATLHFGLLKGCEIAMRDEAAETVRYRYGFIVPAHNRMTAAFLRRVAEVLIYRSKESIVAESRLESELAALFESVKSDKDALQPEDPPARIACDKIASLSDEELLAMMDSRQLGLQGKN